MKISRRILLSAAIASTLALGGVAWSAYLGGGHPGTTTDAVFSPEAQSSLGITDAQKAQLKALVETYKASAGPLLKEFAAERRDLRKLVHTEPVSDDAIRSLANRMAGTGAALAVQRAHFFHDLRSVFTPEQIKKIEEILSKSSMRTDLALGQIARSIAKP